MTARTFAMLLATAAWLCAGSLPPRAASAATGAESWIVAQTASPLEIPAAPVPVAPQPGTTAAPSTTQTPGMPPAAAPAPAEPGAGTPAEPPAAADDSEGETPPGDEELSLGEIPVIETIELTPELARRALDSYIMVKEKYVNSDLDQYENLEDFVAQTEDGKNFETDVKAAGFANVTDWNLAVTTLGLTYGSVVDDQTSDLLQQIKEVEDDTDMAQDIKDRMVKALKALIPSDNNKKVVEDLIKDPVYGEKVKLLDIEEE